MNQQAAKAADQRAAIIFYRTTAGDIARLKVFYRPEPEKNQIVILAARNMHDEPWDLTRKLGQQAAEQIIKQLNEEQKP